jgi:hypothetical protein
MESCRGKEVARRLAGGKRLAKLASPRSTRHHPLMRILVTASAMLLLAACAPRVAAPVEPASTPATPVRPTGGLFGVTANDLIARFGQPSFQVREGSGTKLQWSQNGCVLDAYLYPPPDGQGVARVAHIDTRRQSGDTVPLVTCLGLMNR